METWDEQGSGVFTGAGGTVLFQGLLPQTITQNAGSSFNNLQIGDGTGSDRRRASAAISTSTAI